MFKMWIMNIIVLLVLTILYEISAFQHFIPQNKDVIYDWKATVTAGTHLPLRYGSVFILNGKILLQSHEKSTFVKITNLTYKLYNGNLEHFQENEAHVVPLPTEALDIQKPFKIVYDVDGLIDGIVTENGEKEFSRNIKKALATTFQMNHTIVSVDYKQPESFLVKEKSLYEYGFIDYTIYPQKDGKIEVHKLYNIDKKAFHNHPRDNLLACDLKTQQHKLDSKRKIYQITKNDGNHIIEEIQTFGSVIYYPFQAKSDAQDIITEQTFHLTEIKLKEENFNIQNEKFEKSLTYHLYEESDEGIIDVTNGRHVIDYEKLFPQVEEMLKDIPLYLKENHINTEEPDTKKGQLINRVQRLLAQFNAENLKKFEKRLSGDVLKIFYRVLSLVDTRPSVLHIKNLIVNKIISDDLAVELLQQMPENFSPPVKFLVEIEDLIHLNTSFSWEVRKVALLTFATFIYKSHNYEKLHHPETSEKQYEKYVDEYVARIEHSEYKEKMVYILALRNMKLTITLKHLVPIFHDQKNNEHIRFLSMWASTSVTVKDNVLIFKTLWPIFSNSDELTEIRNVAFFYMMKSNPDHSQLRKIFTYMMTEKNPEVYRWYYTFLQAIAQSQNPCNEEMRTKVSQILKFSQFPTHGISGVKFYQYSDAKFGFGSEIEHYFINTSRLQMNGVFFNSRHNSWYEEDYFYYLKIYTGKPGEVGLTYNYLENVLKLTSGIAYPENLHVEGVITKRDQIINTYFFNKTELSKIIKTLNFTMLFKNLRKDSINMFYQYKHHDIFHNDLGFPVMHDLLMPEVNENEFNLKNGLGSIKIEGKFVSWIHYRHGISFYNPISDVWQGINRYQSYDSVFPLNLQFEYTSNKNYALSWKKHHNPLMDTAGVKTHVKQMVFIKDDYNRNIRRNEFQEVSFGKKYRHDYTLVDVDHFATGHKWYFGIFDSEIRISNGSFKHQMELFAQPFTKQFDSPIEQLVLSIINLKNYAFMSVDPGIYGYILKIEPSHKYDISNINLKLFLNYTHATFNPHIFYTIANEKHKLRTYEVNTFFEINHDFNVAKFNSSITRSIPLQKNYMIEVKGMKEWSQEEVRGNLNIMMGQHINDTAIDISMIGKRSFEQTDGKHKYSTCKFVMPYSDKKYYYPSCFKNPSSIRQYEYAITTQNLPSEFKKKIINFWNNIVRYYHSYYIHEEHDNNDIADNNLKINVLFPIEENQVDVRVSTDTELHELSGLPGDYLSWFGLFPDNTGISNVYLWLHDKGWLDHCIIDNNHPGLKNTWTLYIEEKQGYYNVQLKLIGNDTIALKLTAHNHTFETIPQNDSYQIILDGRDVSLKKQHYTDWMYFIHEDDQPTVFMLNDRVFGVKYDDHTVLILTWKYLKYGGKCFI